MKCVKCDTEKEKSEFYANDKKCKECRREMVRANRKKKAEYYREYDKKRFKDDPRVKERHKRYQKTEAGKIAASRANKKWIDRNPIKRAAHILVGNAIRAERLIKEPCEVCGCDKVNGHHDDYAKPLEVRWLCDLHHSEWHELNGEGANSR